jgi:hypothetical protein
MSMTTTMMMTMTLVMMTSEMISYPQGKDG